MKFAHGESRGADGDPGGNAFGGAILNEGSFLIISNCAFESNRAIGGNGAQNAFGKGGDGGLAFGGAIYSTDPNNFAGLTVVNSTFWNNSVAGGNGGFGFAGGNGREGGGSAVFTETVSVFQNSTFSSNIARGGNGGESASQGGNGGNGTGAIQFKTTHSRLPTVGFLLAGKGEACPRPHPGLFFCPCGLTGLPLL